MTSSSLSNISSSPDNNLKEQQPNDTHPVNQDHQNMGNDSKVNNGTSINSNGSMNPIQDSPKSQQKHIHHLESENQRLKAQIQHLTEIPSGTHLFSRELLKGVVQDEKDSTFIKGASSPEEESPTSLKPAGADTTKSLIQKMQLLYDTVEKMSSTMEFLWQEMEYKETQIQNLKVELSRERRRMVSHQQSSSPIADSKGQSSSHNSTTERIQNLTQQRLENLEHQVAKKISPRLFMMEQWMQNVMVDLEALKMDKQNGGGHNKQASSHSAPDTEYQTPSQTLREDSTVSQQEMHLLRARERIMKLRHEFSDLLQYSNKEET